MIDCFPNSLTHPFTLAECEPIHQQLPHTLPQVILLELLECIESGYEQYILGGKEMQGMTVSLEADPELPGFQGLLVA